MKSRYFLLTLPLSCLLSLPAWAQPGQLKLQVSAEEPSGVFFDRDTINPQTPLLFTARLANPGTEQKSVTLTWRVTGADGREKWERDAKFDVAAGDSIVRRELFDAPSRGGYLLEVSASIKQKGPNLITKTALPFAVTVSPSPTASGAARPQSFFVLTAPALLADDQLDFYSRIGAHVLRSPLPPEPVQPDWPAVEAQLGARLKRNIATVALLPISSDSGRSSEAYFARQVPATLARYGALTTWELAGDLSPADLDGWAQLARGRRTDLSLLGPLPDGLSIQQPGGNAQVRLSAIDGVTFNWPDNIQAHPAALRRLWLSRGQSTKDAGLSAFHLRRDTNLSQENQTPATVAGVTTADFLSSIMAGASSMSEALAPPKSDESGARAMAQGAAFAMMTRTLEDCIYREELFPRSPALEGALFRASRGSIAVLYATAGQGKMSARVSPARVYDLFGNPLAQDKDGRVEIPLSDQPVYVLADVPADVLGFAIRDAKVEDIRPLEAQVLPISRVPGAVSEGRTGLRVRLQNTGLGDRRGRLDVDVPKGWKLNPSRQDYALGEGEIKTYDFKIEKSAPGDGPQPITVSATSGSSRYVWRQVVPVATATNITPGNGPRLDGDLNDWADASWMSAGPNAANVSARVAFKWDSGRLFIAAKVQEPGLAARRPDEPAYEFWKDHDGLQIAFGTSDNPEATPKREPFTDSDYGFLLCPFNQRGANDFDGRVLRLWGPDKPYNTVQDRVRWAGAVPGASCVIRRDEASGTTYYEARMPLSTVPELQPLEKAAKDGLVRFGWLLHNDEGAPLDWGRAAGNFPWWDNTSSFLPQGELTSALRGTLGFTQVGDVEIAVEPRPAPPKVVAPLPVVPIVPSTPRPIVPNLRPVPGTTPRNSVPRPVAPARPAPHPTPRQPLKPQPELEPFVIPPAPIPPTSPNVAPPQEESVPNQIPPAAPVAGMPKAAPKPVAAPSAVPPRGHLMPQG